MSKARKSGYHHGALQEALIRSALEIIAREGLEGLTLRKVARHAGVSHAAPAHHFEDLRGLLAALAEEGYQRLLMYMQELPQRAGDTRHEPRTAIEGLQAVGAGYIRFAAENPGHFRTMFHHVLRDKRPYPGLSAASRRTLDFLVSVVEACQQEGSVRQGDARRLALYAWSTVHGISALMIDDQLHTNAFRTPAKELAREITQDLYFGLAALRPPGS